MKILYTAIILSLACASAFAADTPQPIKIGFIGSYTGLPHYLERGQNGARMAVDEFNEAGGFNGQKVELIIRDDRASPQDALQTAEDLVAHEKVTLLTGTSFSHIGLALSNYADKVKIPYFTTWCDTEKCDVQNGDAYHFIFAEHPNYTAKALASYAAKLPAKRWAMLGNPIEWSIKQREHFAAEMKRLRPDVEFVDDQTAPFGKANGSSIVEALKWKQVDGVFVTFVGTDLVNYVRAARVRHLWDGISYIGAYVPPEEIAFMKEEAPIGWYVLGYAEDEIKDPANQAFIAAFKQKYNEEPGVTGLQTYTNVKLALAALKKAGSTDPDKIRHAAEGLSIESPTGPITLDAKTHRVNFPYWFGRIAMKDGKPVMTDYIRNSIPQ